MVAKFDFDLNLARISKFRHLIGRAVIPRMNMTRSTGIIPQVLEYAVFDFDVDLTLILGWGHKNE